MSLHERIVGTVLYVLAGACLTASLIALTRAETGWMLTFAATVAVLVHCVWNIEDQR